MALERRDSAEARKLAVRHIREAEVSLLKGGRRQPVQVKGVIQVVKALILAGAPNTKKLTAVSPESYEALIPIAGRPMVDFVVAALEDSSSVEQIVIVGPEELGYLKRGKCPR